MNITLKQLRVFTYVYELRSFTLAAEALNMTQSAVSKACAELEAATCVQLFERSTRHVTPLAAAGDLYEHAQQILGSLRQAERSLAGLRDLASGCISFASSPMMAYGLLRTVVSSFSKRHPSIQLRLHELSTDESLDFIRSGKGDFALVSVAEQDASMTSRVIRREPICLACASSHPLARARSLTWARVAAEPHITIRSAYRFRRRVDQILAEQHLQVASKIEVGTLPSALGLVRENLGVTVVPAYAAEFARHLGLAIVAIATEPGHLYELSLLTRRGSRPTPAADAFINEMTRQLQTA